MRTPRKRRRAQARRISGAAARAGRSPARRCRRRGGTGTGRCRCPRGGGGVRRASCRRPGCTAEHRGAAVRIGTRPASAGRSPDCGAQGRVDGPLRSEVCSTVTLSGHRTRRSIRISCPMRMPSWTGSDSGICWANEAMAVVHRRRRLELTGTSRSDRRVRRDGHITVRQAVLVDGPDPSERPRRTSPAGLRGPVQSSALSARRSESWRVTLRVVAVVRSRCPPGRCPVRGCRPAIGCGRRACSG